MKLRDYIFALTLTFCICTFIHNTIADIPPPQQINTVLLDRLDAQSQQILQLEQEKAAAIDQLKAFGHWWKDWASKNSFPGGLKE